MAAVVVAAIGANTPAQQRAALHSHGVLHPWFHLGLFGLIAWLAVYAARSLWVQAVLLFAVIAFGAATEFVEYWYHASALEANDILLDACGAVLGAGAALLLQRRTRQLSEGHWE